MVSPQNEDAPLDDVHNNDASATTPPPPRRRSLIGRLLKGVALLAVIVGAGGYGAIAFKDVDPRVAIVAEYVEQGLGVARGLLEKGDAPTESPATTTHAIIGEQTKPKVAEPAPLPEIATPPQLDDEAVRKAQREAEETVKAAEAKAQAEADARARAEEEARAAESKLEADRKAAEEKAAEERAAQQRAADTQAETARAAAASAAKAAVSSEELSLRDQMEGLEGRIDAIGDQIGKLRERLDSPKNESRAAPEEEKPSATTGDSSAARVVVAYALQRRLETGKPFVDEIAALRRLGADAVPLDALAPLAERGAPTAETLHAEFSGLAKKLHGGEEAHASGDLTEKLLEGASKLVKVRPAGQPAPTDNSFEAKLARVDAALAHNNLAGAETAFEALPDAARSEAKAFGEALHARLEADRAAEALLSSGIAALGAGK